MGVQFFSGVWSGVFRSYLMSPLDAYTDLDRLESVDLKAVSFADLDVFIDQLAIIRRFFDDYGDWSAYRRADRLMDKFAETRWTTD